MEKFGKTWWSEQWLQSLSHIDYSNRIPRGATYARNGSVRSLDIQKNVITATVQGTYKYKVSLQVTLFTAKESSCLMDRIMQTPSIILNLINHQLNKEVLDIANELGIKIFPTSWKDLKMKCSCPDSAVPCKHIAAVIYLISKEIDHNPFLVFQLHGLDILAELEARGIRVNKDANEVPTFASLLHLIDKPTPDFNEENAYQRISYCNLQDLKPILPKILTSKPSFETERDFREDYEHQIYVIAKNVSKVFTNPSKIGFYRQDIVIPVDKHTEIQFVMNETGEKQMFFNNAMYDEINSLRAIFRLDVEQLPYFTPSVAATYRLAITAATLLLNGAVVPQIYISEDQAIEIRWIPAMIDAGVREIVQKCETITPPNIWRVIIGAPTRRKFKYVANPGFETLSFLITQLVRFCNKEMPGNPCHLLFFYHNIIDQNKAGNNSIGSNIASWLSKLHNNTGEFRPVVTIQENKDDSFGITMGIEKRKTSNEPPIGLRDVLTKKKYANICFPAMQSCMSLAPFIPQISPYIDAKAKEAILYNADQLSDFLFNLLPIIRIMDVKILMPKSLNNILRPKATLQIKSNGTGDKSSTSFFSLENLLDFDWQIAIGDQHISLTEFRKLFRNAGKLVKIKDQYVYLSDKDIEQILNQIENAKDFSQARLMQIALSEEFYGQKVLLDDSLKRQIAEINIIQKVALPKHLKAKLRSYQETGYWWMYRNAKLGLGSIIADDMGLGKTLQVITLLLKMKQEDALSEKRPAIVVVPTSLLFNWENEITRFAPDLSHFIYHGPTRNIKDVQSDVLLTTYGILRSDVAELKKLKPSVLIIDEAQNIKNSDTAQTKAVKTLKVPVRIAMSGTPVENRLSEFWSIMDFTNKGLLGTLKHFNEEFGRPIQINNDEAVAQQFRKITAPFMMRRLKTDKTIINDLPDKIEQNEYCTLTTTQAALYEKTLQVALNEIKQVKATDNQTQFKRSALVLRLLTSLKQICNHPAQYLKNGQADADSSGKTEMLLDLLDSINERQEKVLIFTQYAEMGELLKQMITERYGEEPLFYHGGCSVKERNEMVDKFQHHRNERILILTIKAAGTGLNLTAASHIIHYDLWWNPAVEAQATDRAYRIGQDKNVMVHRFITRNTFEERINEMIQNKKHLADMTVSSGETWIGQLSDNELKSIFTIRK